MEGVKKTSPQNSSQFDLSKFSASVSSNNANMDIVEGLDEKTLCCCLAATDSSPIPNAKNNLYSV